MKRLINCISIMLALMIILIISIPAFVAEDINIISPEEKITDALFLKMEVCEETDRLPVSIWCQDINQSIVEQLTEAELGYSKESISQDLRLPNTILLNELRTNTNNKSDEMAKYLTNTYEIRMREKELSDNYIAKRREISTEQYKNYLNSIVSKCNISDSRVIFQSKYAPFIIAELSINQIQELSKNKSVESLDYHIQPIIEACTVDSAKYSSGQSLVEDGLELTGDGVKVGMADGGYPAPNEELDLSSIIKVGYPDDDGHATNTAVTLVGRDSGFSKDITLYSTNYGEENIEALLDAGCVLINISFGYMYSESDYSSAYAYSVYDRWIDHIVDQHNVTVVVSAGNDAQGTIIDGYLYKRVISPAMGKNVITVGAFNDLGTSEEDDDILCNYSSYKNTNGTEITTGVEKPDVILPANLLGGGTSTSAPIMTAIIAQILQLKPSLAASPQLVKAIVLASCHRKVGSSSNDEPEETMSSGVLGREAVGSTSGITECQGAGVPNAWTMAKIVIEGTYSVGKILASGATFYIEQPPYEANMMNFSIAWMKSNYINGDDHTNLYNVNEGSDADLSLSVYNGNERICYSNLSYSSTEMCYFPLSTDSTLFPYKIVVANNYPHAVKYAYAWSTNDAIIRQSSSQGEMGGIYYIRNAVNNKVIWNNTNANTTYLQAGVNTIANCDDITNSHKWILRESSLGYSLCTGEGTLPSYLGVSNYLYGTGLYADLSGTEYNLDIRHNDDNTISIFNGSNTKILTCDNNYLIWIDYDNSVPVYNTCKWYFDKINYALGDANTDGSINASDYIYLQRALVHVFSLTNIQCYLGNINGDDELDMIDVTLLQRMLMS